MKLRLFLLILVVAECPRFVKSADIFYDQPKILVNDGNLVFESADSKNVSIRLKGKSRFLVNDVDILENFQSSGRSTGDSDESNVIKSLQVLVAKLKSTINNRKGILNRLDRLELGIPSNSSSSDTIGRSRAFKRRVATLEQKVSNLTDRLVRDHCKSYPCQNGGTCFNMFDTYRCECIDAWEGPSCSLDVNECAKFSGTELGCQNGATCINTEGSYECQCTAQWKGQHCTRMKMDCLNVPQSEICGHGTCVQAGNKFGYTCICEQGWRQSNQTYACTVDVDECSEMRPHCSTDPKVLCVNTPGSFVCGPCPSGFVGNGFVCEDTNECEMNNGGCSVLPKVECRNKRGSSRCANCPPGYSGDGKTCTPNSIRPKLECADSSICSEHAQCIQYPNGPPVCQCRPEYTGNGFGDNGCSYVGIDACNAVICQNGGTCLKNGTSAFCVCPRNVAGTLCEQTTNACDSNPCENDGNCTTSRSRRGYRCSCIRGFSGADCENQVRRCGGVLNAENGSIRYPENPNETYSHNSRCAWLIKTNNTKVLNVTFTKFDIERNQMDCKFDWLQIHDGRSSSAHMIGRFCGNTLPRGTGNIISTHNTLYLWFRSDNSTSREGFELTWESIDPVCGGYLDVVSHGTIASPGSPGNYPMNRDCEWSLHAPPGRRIKFLFQTLMIEAHETCAYDYVEIHSGFETFTPSLGKFCNTTTPQPLTTPSNTALIHFHSDGDSSDAGFQIGFLVVVGYPGCGGTYTQPTGEIVSPMDADGKHQVNVICEYVIQMPQDSRVRISFEKFSLEDSIGCSEDEFEVFEGNVYENEKLIGRYCGKNKPPVITSLTNIVTVRFTAYLLTNDEGFVFEYKLVCGGVFAYDNGSISSPNYPNPYDSDRNCEYFIEAPLGKIIVLNIIDLDIEVFADCRFDYLEVLDGVVDDKNSSLGIFCGTTKPPGTLISSVNHMRVHFISDDTFHGRGFTANYSFVDVQCGGVVKNATEVITPPMEVSNGESIYKKDLQCRWVVYAPVGHVIQMTFAYFSLEPDSNCENDFVEIFNNGVGSGNSAGRFCGKKVPKVLTSVSNIATVFFKTDSITGHDGFAITLEFVDSSKMCSAKFFSSTGTFASPERHEFPPYTNCEWVITAPENQQIELVFEYFEMENNCNHDALEIRNGDNIRTPLIGIFCGDKIPFGIKSFSNKLYFRFTSYSSNNFKGFKVSWDATTTGCGGQLTSSKGSISSPNYPEPYTHNALCEWQISISEGSAIDIIFIDFDMQGDSGCEMDFLEIFDGVNSGASSIGKFCSSDNHPIHIETSGKHALLRLATDDSLAGRGFSINYTTKCNRTIYANTGVIESPNFPADYPPNTDCAWTIVVPKGNRISYQFSHFEIEDHFDPNETNEHNCRYDWIKISEFRFESKDETNQKVKYCREAPSPKNSTNDAMTIYFHSDSSESRRGFRMEWYIEGCGGKLNHPQGTITSPNYPDKYDHEVTCIWEITVEYGHKIEVTINDIDLELSSTCDSDSLTLAYDKDFNDTIATVCSSQDKNHVTTTKGHQLFVKFESDGSLRSKGFQLTYKAVLSDCGGNFFGSNGIISTPGYPTLNYENNKVCEWKIKTDDAHSLFLQFMDFDLEQSDNCTKDYVEIFDPFYNRRILKDCGSHVPNSTTMSVSRNELIVRLVTDGATTAKGFKASFTSNCGKRISTDSSGTIQYHTNQERECLWTIKSANPSKKIVLMFTFVNIFFIGGSCTARIDVFEGDSDKGPLKKTFCGARTPPAIYSNGNALTIKLNTTNLQFVTEFTVHYSVVDNACGGDYSMSMEGEFASPKFPDSTPLNVYCIWKISAAAGNKMSLTFNNFDIASSPKCNDNYLEIRKNDRDGPLIGVYCGNELPSNIGSAQSYWVKYRTDSSTTSAGFLAEYKYNQHSDLEGSSGIIEFPSFLMFPMTVIHQTYRITVKQGSVIRLEFPVFYLAQSSDDDCVDFVRVFNGYDDTAPIIPNDICSQSPKPMVSDSNIVYIEFTSFPMLKTKLQITWTEVDKVQNLTNLVDSECGNKVILLKNQTDLVNITSPGYPGGYDRSLNCTWTIMSAIPHFHPVVVFKDANLEDVEDCIGDYVKVSADRDDGTWKELAKLCTYDIRERQTFDGTPNLMLQFSSDYGVNGTGFHAYTLLECGGKLTDSEGIIEYTTPNIFRLRHVNECQWNITVRRGKTIQFEFISLNILNITNGCSSYVSIRNGIDNTSPFLGVGQYCGSVLPKVPKTSSNHAFVKFKMNFPMQHAFKLRYYEVQHECGGQIQLTDLDNARKFSTPNYPNIPHPHIECIWTVLAPAGKRIRIDFIERFDLTSDKSCQKEYVELRDGLTTGSSLIGQFCKTKPNTQRSSSNAMLVKFFTDVVDPRNGFSVNVSIDVCGGSVRSDTGYLTSSNYPSLSAYPSKAQCDYRISGRDNTVFNLTIVDLDLPPIEGEKCNLTKDHVAIYSVDLAFIGTDKNSLIEIATLCGSVASSTTFLSGSNEILVRFNTFTRTNHFYRGFKLFYNASKTTCGGNIEGETGIITSPGYPSKFLKRLICSWRITVPESQRVKLEFLDVDLPTTTHPLLAHHIGVYNDFKQTSRLLLVTGSSDAFPIFSSGNQMMVAAWISVSSNSRGFKLKFSSDTPAICQGNLREKEGVISPPKDQQLTNYICKYSRDRTPIIANNLNLGTLAFYFRNIKMANFTTSCRLSSSSHILVKRVSGASPKEELLAKICDQMYYDELIVVSPFPDVVIEIRQAVEFGQLDFAMNYKTHACGGVFINEGSKVISNPLANFSNEESVDCGWFFKYEEGFSISITVSKLDFKLQCEDEHIAIYNGPTALSPVLDVVCVNYIPNEVLVSQTSTVFMVYHTTNFIGSSKNSVFELKVDSTISDSCGGILNSNNKMFKSPLYEKGYPPNTECIWEIRSDSGFHVGLSFVDRFFLEDSENCTRDYVEAFDYIGDEWKSLGRRCGRDVPKPFNATSTRMKVVFRSDASGNGDGFSAVWNQNCGGIYEVSSLTNVLSSPAFPNYYPPNLSCNYTFVGPPGLFMNIDFVEFSLESARSKCSSDNVTVYKGPDFPSNPPSINPLEKLGVFCGTAGPGRLRIKNIATVIFQTDQFIGLQGWMLYYKIEDCGGTVTSAKFISSPKVVSFPGRHLGSMQCQWNITAPVGKKIVIKFEKFSMGMSSSCRYDFVELYNGTEVISTQRLVKICSNLTNIIKPINTEGNEAVLLWKTEQNNADYKFSAAIYFRPKCDETIRLTSDKSYTLDKFNEIYSESMECAYKVVGEPLSSIKMTFNSINLSICDPDAKKVDCSCDYVEVHDGNGPFSASLGKYCGYDLPPGVTSTGSALYIRFVTDSIRPSTGFKATFSVIPSPCGSHPYRNFTGNETKPVFFVSPRNPGSDKYLPNIRCTWTIETIPGKIFDIQFNSFELEESKNCASDSLTIEDDTVNEYVTEGLGEEVIYSGKSLSSYKPTFYEGISGPTAPSVYCGSTRPHDYISESNKIQIHFNSNSERELSGFNFTIKTMQACSRNFTALTGRLVTTNVFDDCLTTITVPENYTISLFFHKFWIYEQDCQKAFLKVYDGSFDDGALLNTFCGYSLPNPVFSTKNQLSLSFKYDENNDYYTKSSFNILYIASDKGRGCGGEVFNYGGLFSSPMFPSTNRSTYDCTWTVTVPQNLKVALRFHTFDMGSKLICNIDYVEFLEENESGIMTTIKRYCGDDNPAVYVSTKSTLKIHHKQTVNFAGTGWIINFMGVNEGAMPQNW